MTTLICENVTYQYEKGSKVLEHITTQFETGKMYAILGASGSGKTTLLSLIGGLDIPQEGKIMFNGRDISEMGLESHRRNHVSVIFQNYNLVPVLNVYENIVLPIELDGSDADKNYVGNVIKTLGLEQKLASMPNMLSGGQQQRVAIARALAYKPAIILADEPTGNLDSKTSMDVISLLKVTSREFNQTIVMITHNEEIALMADRRIRIEDGKVQ